MSRPRKVANEESNRDAPRRVLDFPISKNLQKLASQDGNAKRTRPCLYRCSKLNFSMAGTDGGSGDHDPALQEAKVSRDSCVQRWTGPMRQDRFESSAFRYVFKSQTSMSLGNKRTDHLASVPHVTKVVRM